MRGYSFLNIVLAAPLFLSLCVHLTGSIPVDGDMATNATENDKAVNYPKLRGCICPWESGDNGCHIVGAPTSPRPDPLFTAGNQATDAVSQDKDLPTLLRLSVSTND